jgi:general secretion pathway protein G
MSRRGFTVVELLMVMVILGALSFIAVPRITGNAQTAKQRACETNIGILNSQMELYKTLTGSYPASLDILTGNVNYFPDGVPVCPLDGTYQMNSEHRVTCTHSNPPACGG